MKNIKQTIIESNLYDKLIWGGTAGVLLGIIFLATVFLGTFTLGRISVILGILLVIAGGIVTGNGIVMKRDALGETEDYYCNYKEEKKKAKQTEE